MLRSFVFIFAIIISPLTFASGSILVIGDSISAAYGLDTKTGWVSLLESKLTQEKKPYQVINASISGDTTINGLNRLQPLLKKYSPDIVIIELGGNDGLRGLSTKIIKQNLKQMIVLAHTHKAKVLLAGMRIPPNYGKRYTEAFYQVFQELAREFNIGLIPFLLEGVGDKPELMQNDGIHPAKSAQVIILETVWQELEAMI